MKYFLLALMVVSAPTMAGTIQREGFDQDVELPYHHPRSKIGQDPITFNETLLCHHLEDQAWNGPLSWRKNLTGSIGTCDRETGVCAIYWLDTDLCDVIDTAAIAVDRRLFPPRPKKSRIEELQDAVNHCYSGAPKFGPQAPCEMYENMLEKELQ